MGRIFFTWVDHRVIIYFYYKYSYIYICKSWKSVISKKKILKFKKWTNCRDMPSQKINSTFIQLYKIFRCKGNKKIQAETRKIALFLLANI